MKIIPLQIHSQRVAKNLMQEVGVDYQGIKIMAPKMLYSAFKIEGVSSFSANIIKQSMLSVGSDAAVSRNALTHKMKTSLIIFGTLYQIKKLVNKLKKQPPELKALSVRLEKALKPNCKKVFYFRARNKKIRINRPLVCGIINVTPDSFSGDGLLNKASSNSPALRKIVLDKVEIMIKDGAGIIDIGGESSRPYSFVVKEDEELKRVIPSVIAVRKRFPRIPISVDTSRYRVAKEAVACGADIINDITALRNSPQIVDLIVNYGLGCILMHMKGSPRSMQKNPHYRRGVIAEILDFLEQRVEFCINHEISKDQLMVDPGIGFGKTIEDNYKILNKLHSFKILGLPLFLGVSRKSFLGKVLKAGVEERETATISALVTSFLNGADVLRVHNVKAACQALKVAYEIVREN